MPEHTYIHQKSKTMPGFKAFKGYIMLLWDRDVVRFKLKPFLTYHSENPRACRNMRKHIGSVQSSHSVVSDSLPPHGLWHVRLPCPSPTPRACSKRAYTSIYCCRNREAWMTLALFENWFLNCLILHTRECCRQNIQFKTLLILDNAPRHPHHISSVL